MATAHVNQRVQKHRDALRMAGLRPVQIWVPDTRRPDFAEECRRQCLLVAQADSADSTGVVSNCSTSSAARPGDSV